MSHKKRQSSPFSGFKKNEETSENLNEEVGSPPSRRQFIQATTAGAAIAIVGASCDKEDMSDTDAAVSDGDGGSDNDEVGTGGGGNDDTGDTNAVESDNDTGQTTSGDDDGEDNETTGNQDTGNNTPVGEAPPNRVVRIIDSGATNWSGGNFDDFYQYGVQDVVDEMYERGLMALTGTDSLEAAWRSLIPYSDGDLVAIHPNCYVNTNNNAKNNVYQSLNPIIYGLVDVLGIPPDKVAVSDPSRPLLNNNAAAARIVDKTLHTSELNWDLYEGEYGSPVPFTSGHEPRDEMQMARLMEEADHIIVFPVLSWHGFNWITGGMKVIMGSLTNMASLHGDSMQNGPRLGDVYKVIQSRTRLIVGDGLFGNTVGNSSSPHAFQTLGGDGGNHPSSTIYLSRDIVALDCVMFDDLLTEARTSGSNKSGYSTGFLKTAEEQGIGTYEMLDETGQNSYSKINLVDV